MYNTWAYAKPTDDAPTALDMTLNDEHEENDECLISLTKPIPLSNPSNFPN